jgi:hypothetical protein
MGRRPDGPGACRDGVSKVSGRGFSGALDGHPQALKPLDLWLEIQTDVVKEGDVKCPCRQTARHAFF